MRIRRCDASVDHSRLLYLLFELLNLLRRRVHVLALPTRRLRLRLARLSLLKAVQESSAIV